MILLEMLKQAIPLKLAKSICIQSSAESRGSLSEFYSQKLGTTVAALFGEHVPHSVSVECNVQALTQLQALGIPANCIPVSMGGDWDYSRLFILQANQTLYKALVAQVPGHRFYQHPLFRCKILLVPKHCPNSEMLCTLGDPIPKEKGAT